MFHLQRRLGKITRQTAAARFFGWPIEGGCSPISVVLGGDYQAPLLARFALPLKLLSIFSFIAFRFNLSGGLFLPCMIMWRSVFQSVTFGMAPPFAR
jgi:hypothetical protein